MVVSITECKPCGRIEGRPFRPHQFLYLAFGVRVRPFCTSYYAVTRMFGFPSTYACMNPSHFVLTEGLASGGKGQPQTTRPMDSMSYSWASPQEDEFALFALGAPSPYESLIVPSLMRDPKWLVDLRQRQFYRAKTLGQSVFQQLLAPVDRPTGQDDGFQISVRMGSSCRCCSRCFPRPGT